MSFLFKSFPEFSVKLLLRNLKVITHEEVPTLLGLLFFGKSINFILPQAGIEMFRYAGELKDTDIMDHKSDVLIVPELIEIGERFVKYNSSTKAIFNSNETRREDISEYPDFVIRELLANAFAHRDWSIFGQRIRIEIYSDRLEVFSPGRLPNTLELESAVSGVSYYRNPIIAQMLKDYSIVEKSGRGLLKIMNFYKRNTYQLPKIESLKNFFRVTLYPLKA